MSDAKVDRVVTAQDIQRCALGMIEAFQCDAEVQCEETIHKMGQKGDAFGVDVWQRIVEAVLMLKPPVTVTAKLVGVRGVN